MKKQFFQIHSGRLTALAMAIALSACGGGAGDSALLSDTPANNSSATNNATSNVLAGMQVATFVDAPVAGLEYTSPSVQGVTDPLGNFLYMPGETVTFQIGNVVLGEVAPVTDIVRPLDLIPGAIDATDQRVTRILQTLQTIDENADPEDGIKISSAMREHFRTKRSTKLRLDSEETRDEEIISLLPTAEFTVDSQSAIDHYERHLDDESNADKGYEYADEIIAEKTKDDHKDSDSHDGESSNSNDSPTPNAVSAPQPASINGRLLASNCFQCHGTGGMGGFERIKGGDADEVFEYLTRSPAESIMAAHAQGFTREQLQAIVTYLKQ